MEIFKIDSTICDYYSDTKEDEEGANIIVGWCHDNGCECSEVPFDECLVKAIQYCKLKDKQLKRKEQECENNKIAHQMELDIYNQEYLNLQEELKETLEQLDQLKAENYKLKKTLKAIKKDIYNIGKLVPIFECETIAKDLQQILEKVEGVEND